MARPNQESINTFIGITGLPDSLAIQILQEYGGDLNRAVNAHFNHGHGATAQGASFVAPQGDFMDVDEPVLLNPLLMSATDLNSDSFTSHPLGRREIPIEVKNDNGLPSQSGLPATVEDVSRRPLAQGSEAHGTIIIDDDNETSNLQSAQSLWDVHRPVPSAPVLREPDLDIEEEMIRAAIEASKKEAEGGYSSEQFGFYNGSEGNQPQIVTCDAQTASSSFEGALLCENADRERTEFKSPVENEFPKPSSQSKRVEAESSFIQDQPQLSENGTLSRQRGRHLVSGSEDSSADIEEGMLSPPSIPNLPQIQQNVNGFPSDEWGGISSAEHDEAVMLEAAMFGGIPETSEYNSFAAQRIMQSNLNGNIGPHVMPEPRPPSPTLTAQRQLREQQDDEYLASLQADIEKAEARRLEEQAARDAAREEEKRKEEERLRKLEEEQEVERQLAAKEASIPQEPSADDVNAVNLLVRMPDGSRRGRRFLKSDKLKSLFDYTDIGRAVKPNTYRLVRPYPRRAFGDGDSVQTLNELGLTSKQEALYLELI